MYAVVSTSKHDTSPTIEMVLTRVTSYNEALQYLIDRWGDDNNVLSDHIGGWHSELDTPSKLAKRLGEFNSRDLAFHILPISNIVAVDRTMLGTPSDATMAFQEDEEYDYSEEEDDDGTSALFILVVTPNGYDDAYRYLVKVATIYRMTKEIARCGPDPFEAVGLGCRSLSGNVNIMVKCDPAEIRTLKRTRPTWFVASCRYLPLDDGVQEVSDEKIPLK